MLNRLASFVLLAALAGCSSNTLTSQIGLAQPTSVALFTGVTTKNDGLHPYAAIANGARDELTLVDALDDKPVLAPVVVRALAVPTASRPAMVVAGSLHDDGADLLAVLPAGSSTLEIVRTWTADNQVVPGLSVDLGALVPGAQILSAVSAPVADAGTGDPVPGKVRILLGLSGGRLAVLEYAREAGGGVVASAAPVVQAVGFDPVSLSVARRVFATQRYELDGRLVYAATPDDVPAGSGAYGVVELDASGAPGSWGVALLPTRAPTRLVAAAVVAERFWADLDDEIPETSPYVLRVYAALDPDGCGTGRRIDCGIVTVDPAPGVRGLVPDPLGEMPYQAPIRLPAEIAAMAAAIPPAVPPEGFQPGRMQIATGLGAREATAMLAVAGFNGRVYSVDPSRRTVHNNLTMLRDIEQGSQTRTRADVFEFTARTEPKPPTTQILPPILCDRTEEPVACEPATSTATAEDAVEVTPGYTINETFSVVYQGAIFGMNDRASQVGAEAGALWVALQAPGVAGFSDVVRVYDPALGVHVGDTVEIAVRNGAAACDVPDDTETKGILEDVQDVHEFEVTGFAPPDPARFPGGALLLADDGSACQAALRAGVEGTTATVRAAGFVIQGASIGYAGRTVQLPPPAPKDLRFRAELRYVNEDAPEQACPLSPWPADPAAVACDADCRARCERLALARKSRRWYTLGDACNGDGGCQQRWGERSYDPDPDGNPATEDGAVSFSDPFPNKKGPVFGVTFTVRDRNTSGTGEALLLTDVVNRDSGIQVNVYGGHEPTYNLPVNGGAAVLPSAVVPFDRSPWDDYASYRFFVVYAGDVVMDYSPSQPVNLPVSIR